jgi:very-short-patch-repair endonuclease
LALYRLDMGWPERRIAVEYDGEEFHSAPEHRVRDAARRTHLAREFGWHAVGVGEGEVLGASLDLERGVGELLGLEPQIRRRRW